MGKNDHTAAVIDNVLKFMAAGSVMAAALVTPNLVQMLDKPLARYFKKMDRRAQEREMRRVLAYMKHKNLISYRGNYQHGLKITEKGLRRVRSVNLSKLNISKPKKWDGTWRIVMFDIPESYKGGRDALSSLLKRLNFYRLQKSVWLYPYPCREEIKAVTAIYGVNNYVSYIETTKIDGDDLLMKKFNLK